MTDGLISAIKRTAYGVEVIIISNGEEPFITSKSFNGKHFWEEKNELKRPFINFYNVKLNNQLIGAIGEISPNTPLSYSVTEDEGRTTFKLQLASSHFPLPKKAENFEFEYSKRSPLNFPELGEPRVID